MIRSCAGPLLASVLAAGTCAGAQGEAAQDAAAQDTPHRAGAAAPAEETRLVVRVTDLGDPVGAGLWIRSLDDADLAELFDVSGSSRIPDLERLDERLGHAYRTDADGIVRVPASTAPRAFLVVDEARWGFAERAAWRDPAEPTELALVNARPLEVVVFDADGRRRAGVSVVLRRRNGSSAWDFFERRTGGAGSARFLLALQLDLDLLRSFEAGEDRLLVAAAVPGGPPIEVEIDAVAPLGPVVLTLPPTGSLAAR